MRFKNFLFISMILSILSACSAMETREKFDSQLTSYKGMQVDKLIDVWGPARAFHVNNDNTRIYQWVQDGGSTHFPGASYPWIGAQSNAYAPWNHALWPAWRGGIFNSGVGMFVSRPMYLDRSCTLNVKTDEKNIVTDYQGVGEGCVAE
jgi:hypothetical protein